MFSDNGGPTQEEYLFQENKRLRAELAARPRIWCLPWPPVEVARRFHDAYEAFAPSFGYTTREDTRQFDPESPNGKLMIAVIRQVLIEQTSQEYALLEAERDALRSALHDVCDAFLTTDKYYAAMRMHQIAHAALREGEKC